MATPARVRDTERFWQDVLEGDAELAELEQWTMLERVELVRDGVPAALLSYLADRMGISRDKLYQTIGLPRSTGDRKVRSGQRLDADQGERAIGLARLLGQVEQMLAESGSEAVEDFDAAAWLAAWLDEPVPALGGRRPGELMDTAEGRALVSRTLRQMQSGAYA